MKNKGKKNLKSEWKMNNERKIKNFWKQNHEIDNE